MSLFFKKAMRKNGKLRLALSGPPGSGKTFGALMIAKGIGGRIAVVDTENSSAELYDDVVDFEHANIYPPYTPEKFIQAIKTAESAGFDTLILDSITHEWSGVGGCLEIVDALANGSETQKALFKGNSWAAWSIVTPRHRKFIDAMLQSSINIIVTLRSKTETRQVSENNGKKKVEKLGMKVEQREGIEYEFTTVLDINDDNFASATKDRTRIFSNSHKLSENDGLLLKQWLNEGSTNTTINGNQFSELETLMIQADINIANYCANRGFNSLYDLQQNKFDETIESIKRKIQKGQQQQQQFQQEDDAKLQNEHLVALDQIKQAQSLDDLKNHYNYFVGTRFQEVIKSACTVKKVQMGWKK